MGAFKTLHSDLYSVHFYAGLQFDQFQEN